MTARDTMLGIVRQWAERHEAAPETPEALFAAVRAEVLREAINALDERIIAIQRSPGSADDKGARRIDGLCDAVGVLRRMADGSAPAPSEFREGGDDRG